MLWSKCCSNEMDELSWSLHHDYGNTNRERDNFNLWGLNEQTWSWDRWGGTFVKQNEPRDRRDAFWVRCVRAERGKVWGNWSVVAAVTSEKTKKGSVVTRERLTQTPSKSPMWLLRDEISSSCFECPHYSVEYTKWSPGQLCGAEWRWVSKDQCHNIRRLNQRDFIEDFLKTLMSILTFSTNSTFK